MIQLAFSEFVRNIRRNIIVIILLAVVSSVTLIVGSFIWNEWERYYPFKFLDGCDGFFYAGGSYTDPAIKDEYSLYYASVNCDIGSTEIESDYYEKVIALPSWVYDSWKPVMNRGAWISESGSTDDGCIPVVAGGTKAAGVCRVGDVYSIDGSSVRFKVVGIAQADCEMFGGENQYNSNLADYELYYSVNYEDLYFVAAYEAVQKTDIELQKGLLSILTVDDEQSEGAQALADFINKYESGTLITLDEFRKNNLNAFLADIRTYIPILAGVLALTAICVTGVVFVTIENNKKHYSIFYLCGADRSRRVRICLGNACGVVVFSVLLLAFALEVIQALGYSELLKLSLNAYTYGGAAIIYVLYFIQAWVMTALSMRKLSPKDCLRAL